MSNSFEPSNDEKSCDYGPPFNPIDFIFTADDYYAIRNGFSIFNEIFITKVPNIIILPDILNLKELVIP